MLRAAQPPGGAFRAIQIIVALVVSAARGISQRCGQQPSRSSREFFIRRARPGAQGGIGKAVLGSR